VVNSLVALCASADDFGFKRDDAGIQFGDRVGIKVELDQKGERVAGTRGWGDVVGIHITMVKERGGAVNSRLCRGAGADNMDG
jgi:hypothetical protein